ncbi:MAG: DUF2141 domain-containing protein [Leptospirales bacterium]
MKKIILFTVLLGLWNASLNASIIVKVKNIQDIKGNLMVAVYRNQSELEKRIQFKEYKLNVQSKEMTFEISDVDSGEYMIAIFHDVNSNEKLETNFFGIPTEPYGFSLNQMGRFGPSFEKSKFVYDGKSITLEIVLTGK